MDIPVLVNQQQIDGLKLNNLIYRLQQRKLSAEDLQEFKDDVAAIRRLREKQLIPPSLVISAEHRIYRRYCNRAMGSVRD